MAMAPKPAVALLMLGVLALPVLAQFSSSAPKVFARREDIKYINCQMCELLAKNAYKQVKGMFKQATPSHPVTEELVIERIEKLADVLKDEGEWLTQLDLVEEGNKLIVKEMGEAGECGVECKTVEKAAQAILDEHDTDIAEALFVGKKSRAQFSNWLCYELTDSCKKKPPALPKDRTPGPGFKKADPEKVKLDRMMASMQEQGMRGNMYTRDEAIAKYMGEQTGGDEDEDGPIMPPMGDETSEAGHPTNKIASAAMEKGEELIAKAKGAAAPLIEGASAGLQKAKEEAQKLWDKFTADQKKTEQEAASSEL